MSRDTVITFPKTVHKTSVDNPAQRSKQSGRHCHGAFGRCRGPFDTSAPTQPAGPGHRRKIPKKRGRKKKSDASVPEATA
jgi:hypothetical protein